MTALELDTLAADGYPFVAPAYLSIPERTGSLGSAAVDLAASFGRVCDPMQELALDAMLSERKPGQWAALEVCIICSRQNLKTFCMEIAALSKLYLSGSRLVIWTAQRFDTAQETFRNMEEILINYDHMRREVHRIWRGHGEESIELKNGARLKFKARSKTGGRGLSGDDIYIDEAFALQPEHMSAVLPTLSARPNPQISYGSSAGMIESNLLRRLRDRGRRYSEGRSKDPSLVYIEWCAPEPKCEDIECEHEPRISQGCSYDDPEYWRRSNPALDRRITRAYLAAERATLPVAEFGRERLGYWDGESIGDAVDLEAWNALGDPNAVAPADGVPRFAFSVGPKSRSASVAVAMTLPNGRVHVELSKYGSGTDWLPGYLAQLRVRWPLATFHITKGLESALLDRLRNGVQPVGSDSGMVVVEVEQLTSEEWLAACGDFSHRVSDDLIVHLGDPVLSTALVNAATRTVVDQVAFVQKGSTADISALKAVVVAAAAAEAGRGQEYDPMSSFG